MIVGVPTSSITILEETERHVNGIPILTNDSSIDPTPASLCTIISPSESYPLVASELADAKLEHQSVINPKELPFELLAGEECSKYEHDSSDGIIYLTNFRLFVFTTESTCSFINCPLRLIDSIEIKDNIYLYIQCKDLRSFRLVFLTGEKCCFWSRKLLDVISTPTSFDDLFAFKFASSIPNHEYNNRDYLHEEFSRLQLDNDPWRLTDINQKYKICPTYPEINVVPSSITDSELGDVAKFRSYRRFPSVVWKHNNGAVIVRTSQPEVGWLFWRSKEDEKNDSIHHRSLFDANEQADRSRERNQSVGHSRRSKLHGRCRQSSKRRRFRISSVLPRLRSSIYEPAEHPRDPKKRSDATSRHRQCSTRRKLALAARIDALAAQSFAARCCVFCRRKYRSKRSAGARSLLRRMGPNATNHISR